MPRHTARRTADPFGFVGALGGPSTAAPYLVTAMIDDKTVNSVTYADPEFADAMFEETVDGARKLDLKGAYVTITRADVLLREYRHSA